MFMTSSVGHFRRISGWPVRGRRRGNSWPFGQEAVCLDRHGRRRSAISLICRRGQDWQRHPAEYWSRYYLPKRPIASDQLLQSHTLHSSHQFHVFLNLSCKAIFSFPFSKRTGLGCQGQFVDQLIGFDTGTSTNLAVIVNEMRADLADCQSFINFRLSPPRHPG